MGIVEAILIALVLVVQTFGMSYAAGAGGRPVALDAFGNPLCITSGEHGSAGDDTRHGALTDCCTLACTASVQTGGTPPEVIAIKLPVARPIAGAFGPTFERFLPAPRWSPGNPRAPPSPM